VLGHEVGHVTARHVSQQYTRSAGGSLAVLLASIFVPGVAPFGDVASVGLGTLFLKYGRDDELESDRLGVEYSTKAGWDPTGVPRFLETLSRLDALSERGIPNWLSTHPDPGSRVVKAQPVAEQMAAEGTADRNRDEYLRRVDGLTYGDDPAEGVVRGHQFLHPDLRIGIDFPEGWAVQNAPDRVVARLDGEKALMVMQAADTARGVSLTDGATRHMRGLGFTLESGTIEPRGGLDAFVGVYTGKAKGVGEVRVQAVHVTLGRQVYMLAGVAPTGEFARVEAEFATSLASFRQLSGSEAAAVRPNRLGAYVARLGDSWQSIAQRAGKGLVSATRLALMNGFAVNVQPPAGTTLKIVVEG
jgi:predicted Zn-dependent protease